MKKTALIFFIFFLFIGMLSAQRKSQTIKWFSFAAKAGFGNSVFLNTDHIDDGNVGLNYFSLSQSFGGRLTFTYGDNIGIGSELLFSSYNQSYSINNNGTLYDKDVKIKAVDILPFFRYTGNNAAYIELGGKFSRINSVTETNSIQENFYPVTNWSDNYESKFTSVFLGFGFALYKNDRLDVNLGARMAYSFSDLTPNYNITDDGFYLPDYVKSSATNPISVQAILEVNYFFAFWGDANCGRGRLMLFQ